MFRILLIDDEEEVRNSVAKVLGRAGYKVVVAASAQEGIDFLETEAFDILITDIIMPGIDGVQAIRQIREKNPGIKILAISGGGNFGKTEYKPEAITTTAYLQAATEAGADALLTKPFQRKGLTDVIDTLLQAS
jgi:CheY-like chemotaxis protein